MYDKIFKVNELPKLDQDEIVKSITQTSLNKKYGDLVENIIQKKLAKKKEQEDHGNRADDDFDQAK